MKFDHVLNIYSLDVPEKNSLKNTKKLELLQGAQNNKPRTFALRILGAKIKNHMDVKKCKPMMIVLICYPIIYLFTFSICAFFFQGSTMHTVHTGFCTFT